MWVDRNIFGPAVGVVMSQIPIEGRFGETFKKDRSEFSGRSFDPERLRAALPVMRDQTYALLSLARTMLSDGRKFLLGAEPCLADCALYNPVWFIQSQLGETAAPLDRLPDIVAWSQRMKALGGGKRTDITAERGARHRQGGRTRDHVLRCQRSQRAQGRPEDQRHAGRHRQSPG